MVKLLERGTLCATGFPHIKTRSMFLSLLSTPIYREKVIVNETVSLCDLMPTILDVLGYEIPQGH